MFCPASSKLKPKQQFTVNSSLTPCHSSRKRYLRSAGSRSVLHRFSPVCFLSARQRFGRLPTRTPPEKNTPHPGAELHPSTPHPHRPPPSIRRLFAFFHAAPPPSFFLWLLGRRNETGQWFRKAFCLPSHLSKQITALGQKTPYFLSVRINPSNTVPTSGCQRGETQRSAETSVFRCFTRL